MFIQLENNDGTFDDLLAQETSDGVFILLEDAYIVSDQVEIRIPKTRVNEKTNFTATVHFRTRASKAASTPTTIHYRIDDLTTGIEITDWTSVSAASLITIAITPTMNTIQDNDSRIERRQLLVKADSGLSTQAIGQKEWKIVNYYGIT